MDTKTETKTIKLTTTQYLLISEIMDQITDPETNGKLALIQARGLKKRLQNEFSTLNTQNS